MEQIKENIVYLKYDLYESIDSKMSEQEIYLLSVKLDQEIVRYYRSLQSIK